MNSFKDNLKRIRTEQGMTQTGLAKLCGLSNQVISNLERGYTSTVPPDELEKICKALKCKPGDLIPIKDESKLTRRDEIDIEKQLSNTINMLTDKSDIMLSGEVMDDTTKELLILSIKNAMEIAKINNKKYTINKYKK